MNFRKRATPHVLGFQIAPMVDILLVLLVFFIVTWNFSLEEKDLEINLPSAANAEEEQAFVNQVVLNLRSDGTVMLNRKPLSQEELSQKLVTLANLFPDQAVIIRGDVNVPYKHLVSVLDICREAKIWNIDLKTASNAQ